MIIMEMKTYTYRDLHFNMAFLYKISYFLSLYTNNI